jgi:hypothetical protein
MTPRGQNPVLNTQLEPRIFDALRQVAEQERRTLRAQLEIIIDDWMAAHRAKAAEMGR